MRVMQAKFTKTNLKKFQGGGDVPVQTPFAEEPSVFMQWPSAKDLTLDSPSPGMEVSL